MSFSVPVVRIGEVIPIPNADKIEVVTVGGYQSITQKGQYKPGDLAVYIPEAALVPAAILEEMGLTGKLHGAGRNRVKAIKLRGVLSQGLVYPYSNLLTKVLVVDSVPTTEPFFNEGQDVAEVLGVVKWEPEIPAQFKGQLSRPRGDKNLINYDIENIKKHPHVFQDGELVVMTEKIHGTFMQAAYWPETDTFAVSSKGLGARGFVIEDVEANKDNTYIKAAKKFGLDEKLKGFGELWKLIFECVCSQEGIDANEAKAFTSAVFFCGEVYGRGIQDLTYDAEMGFRCFDIYVGEPGTGLWVPVDLQRQICEGLGIELVPLVYRGPFSKEALDAATNGLESVSGKQFNIREGVVVRPVKEREERGLGRVILKSVSESYLTRKDGTEFN